MNRTSRVPYHQNVYDLLQIEPGKWPDAARVIAAHEARYGPLPASVREWYLVPNVVHLDEDIAPGTLWQRYTNDDWPVSLGEVLCQFSEAPGQWVRVLTENQGVISWLIRVNGSADPPVWDDNGGSADPTDWRLAMPTFSEFLASRIGWFYYWQAQRPQQAARMTYGNGLWLRAPAEPFAVPVIDFLTEQFGEPARIARPGGVTTYTWRPPGGTVRVTADDPAHPDPLSAWWVHGAARVRLAEFARLLLPWGTLRDQFRADIEAARGVWEGVRGEGK